MAGLVLVTASSALANASVTTLANANISADTTGGVYTALTGPVLTEGANRDITSSSGTIILSIPSAFQFSTSATVNAVVTRVNGSGTAVALSSAIAAVTTSNITITVTGRDSNDGSTRSSITWSGIKVRPTAGTPLATNNITMSPASTEPINGITDGTTNFGTLTETAGAATKLGYTTAPAATNTAGATMTSVVVQVQDQFGNSVSSNNVAITVALNTGAFASGTTNVNTGAGGSATFNNLVINTVGNYTLTASAIATSFTATPAGAFTVIPAAAGAIQFVQGAPSSVIAGTTFSPAVTVKVTDSFSNMISNKTVTLSLLGGGTLNGPTSQASDGTGVATFSGLSVNQAGTNNALVASISSPSLSITGATFTVTAGSATKLGYTIAPAASTPAGVTMGSIVVQIQDAAGNSIASNGVPITVALNAGGFASGTTTVPTGPDGSATFSDLLLNTSGNYTLTASSAGNIFTATAPAPFTIATGAPSIIQITQDAPAVNNAGAVFSPAVTVLLTDPLANPVTNTLVTLTLNGGGSLSGTVARATAVNGVATFNNLSIGLAGTNYSLTAAIASPSLSVTGNTFVVTIAAATKLVYTTGPVATNAAGVTLPTFVVQVEDQFGNFIPTNGVPISMALNTGTFASGTTPVNTGAGGSASFGDLVITNAGNNTLTASATGLTSATSALTILPGTFAMTFQQDAPSLATAGVTFSPPVAVRIVDPFNNVLSNKTVTLSLNGGGTLNGTLSRTSDTTGVATFTNLTINLVGTNYSLTAAITSPSLSVTGSTFVVNTAPASKLVYATVPVATNTAGQTLPTFAVQITDQFNNAIPTNGVPISMALNIGTFASGTTPVNTAPNGSATFNDLVITNAGTRILTASSTGLTSTNLTIIILPGAANSITFAQGPPFSVVAGSMFTNTVSVLDQFNNGISNATVTLSLNGAATLNGTLSRATTGAGLATFANLSVNTPGLGYSITASGASLSTTSSVFNVTVGPLDHYLVSATTPQTRGSAFSVTVTAQDVASNTVNDSSTVVTMSGSTANVQFDSNGNSIFGENGDNKQVLSSGTFTISTIDYIPETITVTATDANGKTGTSPSITVNAAAGDYRSAATGNWNNIATWQTWNGSSWVAASSTPAGGAGTNITIQSTHTVTDNVAVGLTGTLIAQGSLSFSGGSLSVGSGGVVLNSGTINSTASTLIFNSGGTYDHNYTTASGTIPTAAWNTASTCAVIGFTTFNGNPAGLSQNFYNFVWNCPNQSPAISLGGALTTVNGDFTLVSSGSGTLEGGNTATLALTVAGNVNILGGALLGDVSGSGNSIGIGGSYNQTGGAFSQGSGALAINFTGANKNFIQSGGTLNTGNMSFSVTNNASLTLSNALVVSSGQNFNVKIGGTLNCLTNVVSGSGTFTLSSGGSLGIGSVGGIASSGATGNVQTTTRSFSTGGNYIYNGSASQATGSGLPATVSNLTVTNSGGTVTLGATVSVSSNLTVSAGTFDLGSFTANRATSGGTLTVANAASLKIGGTNPFPANYATDNLGASSRVEYEGSAQNVSAQTYGNLATSGSGTKTLLAGATSLAGDLKIGAGTTFNAVTNSFSLAGNLTNNGTAFAFSGPQTVTFTGSGTQNVSGAAAVAFNTFAIGSNSVISLDNSNSALAFTIAGLNQNGGTWGSTASGATNPDDANFLGNGILNVTPPTFGMSFLQDAPAVTNAGAVFSPPVTVQLISSATNLIMNKMVTLTLNSGTLNGTNASLSQLTDTNGVAVFTNVFITVTGTNYSLIGSITNPSLSVTGNTFVVTTAAATKLVYTSVPAITNTAGGTLSAFTVQIQDQFNNNVASSGVPITMSLASGTFASGTTPINSDVNGTATFGDLVITNAGNNTLTASSPGLTSANRSLVILPAPFAITFQQDAPSVTNAGAVFTPAVAVRIADQFNNVLSNRTVTLSLLNGGTLNGTLSHTTANNGVATFNNLSVNIPGTNYALVASSTNSLSVTGNIFTVTAAPASKLIYTVLPPASSVAGATLTAFTVQIADQFNNSIATNGVPITMSLSNSAFASGTTVSNSDVNGSAGFSDLVITNAGNRILVASAPGLTSTNRAITVTPDVANSTIAFVQEPAASIGAGAVFTNTVQIVDEFNNGVSNASVTLAPNGFATLNGTLSRATAGNGVATFNNLSVNVQGSNYFITATSGSLSTNSSLFNVTVGAIARYVVSASSPQTHDVPFLVTVTAQDGASNTVTTDSSTLVTMNGSTATVQFDANGDTNFVDNTQTLSNGTFTISTKDSVAETITITASDANGKTGTSPAITVTAAGGDYRSAVTGPWNTASTWQIWDGTNWNAATTPPAGGASTNITIQSTHRVTNNVAVALSGTLITQGSLTFNGGSIAVGSGGLVQNSGTINSTAATLIFNAGSAYQHSYTNAAGTIPTATWNPGSTCSIVGYTSYGTANTPPGGLAQSFYNFIWNCPSQTGSITLHADLATVNGDFDVFSTGTGTLFARQSGDGTTLGLTIKSNLNVRAGTFSANDASGTLGTINLGGSYNQTGGTFESTGAGGLTFTFSGANKTFTHSNGTINTANANFTVANGASLALNNGFPVSGGQSFTVISGGALNCGTNVVSGSGGFTLSSGGSLGIGSVGGIASSGATGNVQTTTRSFSTGGNYTYNGSASQATGNGLPATVSNLTVTNSGGIVTLGATVSVSSNLTVSAGTFDLGSFTANRATSGGTLTVANAAALKIGGTNPFPTNYATRNLGATSTIEYEGSAQNVSALPYGNLTTSGSSTKSLQAGATTIAGELTIGPGTTFDAGTNNFSIAGDWSNNGIFASSGSQTVTFNGASPQNVDDGTSLTAFDNVAINSNSVLNLAFTGSDNVQFLTIGGVTEPTGTWGATGSGATHIDDTHFQGTTGTLNVLASLTVPSSTAVISSANPQTYGQPVTFTATVSGTGPVPTGTITFMDGANTMGTGALNGSAQSLFVTNTLPAGLHLITAIYGGDVNFNGSTSGVLSQQISQAGLTVTGITASNKTYDGGTNATLNTGGATLVGVIGTDNVTLNTGGATGFFTDKNVGIGKTVNVSGLTISGPDSGNYTLTQPTASATISALSISVTAATNSKTYDGLTNAAALPTVTTGSLQGTDIGAFSEIYDNKNVGTGKTLTPSGSVIDGNSGLDYNITFLPSNTGVISQRALTVGATGVDKVYDGTTNATVTLFDNRISGDVFTDSFTTASFADANVGSNKTVSVFGIAIAGTDATNYTANTTASTTANITAGSLTISADNKSKTQGLPNPPLTASYVGFVGGDDTNSLTTQAILSTTATTNSPVGTYPITVSGAVAPNYTISYNSGTLTVVAVPQLTTLSISANQFIFSFPTISNQLYQVEYKDDMAAPTWTLSGGQLPGTGGSITVTNAITGQKRFFQVDVTQGQ